MKVDLDGALGRGQRAPGRTDEALFLAVTDAVSHAVALLADDNRSTARFVNNLWRRAGIRYDTAHWELKRHQLTLAIEATDKRTKLKCKQHAFLPEILFDKPVNSLCYPDIRRSGNYRKHDTKFKLEQDLHFDNVKFCASGSLFLKGRRTDVTTLGFFSTFFPGLNTLLPATTPLKEVSRWDEAVFDDMAVNWNRTRISSWMLVNRWETKGGTLLESELSFKVSEKFGGEWDHAGIAATNDLYLALQASGLFMALPPIFTVDNPVSSIDIVQSR